MPSATDFLPSCMTQFVNFATSLSLNFGSGVILRLGTSRRRGIAALLLLGPLDAVLRPAAVAVRLVRARRSRSARRVERAAHDVVAHARQVLHTTAANQDDAVLLKVVSLARNVSDDFDAVRQTHAADLAQRRVRL